MAGGKDIPLSKHGIESKGGETWGLQRTPTIGPPRPGIQDGFPTAGSVDKAQGCMKQEQGSKPLEGVGTDSESKELDLGTKS